MTIKEKIYRKYDLVKIKDLSNTDRSHFPHSCRGIIVSSYNEMYGNKDNAYSEDDEFSVFIEGKGESSWYDSSCFEELLERNQELLLKNWKAKKESRIKQESDVNWIFENYMNSGEEISSTSICALANDLGISKSQMWGSHGEGIVLYDNCLKILAIAEPFLKKKDISGWKSFCESWHNHN